MLLNKKFLRNGLLPAVLLIALGAACLPALAPGTALAAADAQGIRPTAESFQTMLLASRLVNSMMDNALKGFSVYDRPDSQKGSLEGWSGGSELLSESFPNLRMLTWGQPFLHSGRLKLRRGGHLEQDFQGGAAGFALGTEVMNLGFSLHYAAGDLDAPDYEADLDIYGFSAGAGSHLLINERWQPWLALHAGYSHAKLEQKRREQAGGRATSNTDAEVFTAGFTLENSFDLSPDLTLIPRLGDGLRRDFHERL